MGFELAPVTAYQGWGCALAVFEVVNLISVCLIYSINFFNLMYLVYLINSDRILD